MTRREPPTRREVLRAAGVAVALPFLGSLFPRRLFAAPASEVSFPVRAAFVFMPNGVIPGKWNPTTTGASYKLTPTLEPLAPVREEMLVLSGLALDNARAKGDGPGDHARASAAFLTCAHPKKTAGRHIRLGVSADQVLAREVGGATRLASLELGTNAGRAAGVCDSGYSCAYVSNVSWSSETTPVPKEVNPRLVFERLFGSADERRDREARSRRALLRQSVLDYVSEDARRLTGRLGTDDRAKLDEYLTAVREVERRIERAESDPATAIPEGTTAPRGIPRDFGDHTDLMFELLALSFQQDVTRVATFMMENAGSNRSYRQVGVPDGHHQISHHQGNAEKIAKIEKIDRFHIERVARFLERLKAIPEGEGTLLDNSLVVVGSGIGDGNRHSHHDLPVLLAGRGGGAVRPGRHVRYPKNTPLANLYLSVMGTMGAKVDRFGDSTGLLPNLA